MSFMHHIVFSKIAFVKNIPLSIFLFLTALCFQLPQTQAQPGGNRTFAFLNLPPSPRLAGLGGNFASIADNDLILGLNNPSLINEQMHNGISLNFVDYFADVNYGVAAYSRTFEKAGSFVASMQYINYGTFIYTDETGLLPENQSEFSGGDYAFVIGWGRRLDSLFSIGANLKTIYSSLETYNSMALGVDVSGTYHARSGFTASLIARNIGRQLTTYTGSDVEPLPFEIQAAFSKRLNHMPFRYSILLTNLQQWDLTYDDPQEDVYDPFTGEKKEKSSIGDFADKAFRHIVIGGEFLPTKNFSIQLGYNYQRRHEMKVETRKGTVGLSWGFGFKISKFSFNYAHSAYHLTGSPNFLSIAVNLSDFVKPDKVEQ